MAKKNPIDEVTTERLDIALRMCGIEMPYSIVDNIIDLVELIEKKGGKTSINDTVKLQAEWKKHNNTRASNPSKRIG